MYSPTVARVLYVWLSTDSQVGMWVIIQLLVVRELTWHILAQVIILTIVASHSMPYIKHVAHAVTGVWYRWDGHM